MVSDHAKALDAFTTEARTPRTQKFRAAVLKGKTMLAAHKNMAYDLKKELSANASPLLLMLERALLGFRPVLTRDYLAPPSRNRVTPECAHTA
jgi:hypothetical protein